MSSPVPLALESMRGRSALRLVGVVKAKDVRLEPSDEISLYVLTFDLRNMLCRAVRWLKRLDASGDFSITGL
jgi:hypothetical protein